MARKPQTNKVGENKSKLVRAIPRACSDETAAVEFFEEQRWGDTPACPHCGSVDVRKMMNKDGTARNARFLWRCGDCRKQYTVKVGTVMEDSPIPLRYWALAFYRMCASKKGISSLQLQRETGLTYKSALHLTHRIRHVMADDTPDGGPLTGVVEADECYIGGKPRPISPQERERAAREGREIPKNKRGRGTKKAPVFAMVERGGRVRMHPMPEVNGKNLREALRRVCTRPPAS